MSDYVECLACGKQMRCVQWTHFTNNKCRVSSLKEYKTLYPDAKLIANPNDRAVTLQKMIQKYGEKVGSEKYESYCEKQRAKNTFEHKNTKYGWTREDFDEYNKSRSITLDNMVRRYGKERGEAAFDAYKRKQSYTTTLDYFVEKYGVEKGTEKYNYQLRLKSHSLDAYLERYGDIDVAISKLEEFFSKTCKANLNYSKISQELFVKLDSALNENNSYFATKNHEFVKYDSLTKKTYLYDYVIPSIKLCVEFNGDIYHANPSTYTPSEIPKFRSNKKTALEIWKHDDVKNNYLKSLGFDVIVVWESEFRKNPDYVVRKIVDYVNEIRTNKRLQD